MFNHLPQLCIDLIGEKLTETSDIWTKEDVAHDLLVLMAVNKSCQAFAKDLVAKVDPPNDYDRLVVNWKDKKKPTKIMFSTALKNIRVKRTGKIIELRERLQSMQGRSNITGMSYAFTEHLETFHCIIDLEEETDDLIALCDPLGIYIDDDDGNLYYKEEELGDFNIGDMFNRWELLGYIINNIDTLENLKKQELLNKQNTNKGSEVRKLQIIEYLESKELELMDSMLICHEYIESTLNNNFDKVIQEIDDMHFLIRNTEYMKCLSKWNFIMRDALANIDMNYENNYNDNKKVCDMKEVDYEISNKNKYTQSKYEALQRYFRKCKNTRKIPNPMAINIATLLKQHDKYDLVVNGKMRGI